MYERIPEQTPTINDGTGTLWTTQYTYTSFNAVATRKDARYVVTSYSYDALNRLTGISYNTSGASNVASTGGVTMTYDTNQQSATNGLLLSVSVANSNGVGTFYAESYSYDSNNRVASLTRTIEGKSYTTSYEYNQASQLTKLTYPSSYYYYLNHDNLGRLQALSQNPPGGNGNTGYVNNVTYNTVGQVTGMTLGNGVVESYGYDAQRLQLTSQTASKNSTTLLSLSYNYAASAGQSGSGSTAGNSGQLMSITGSIGGLTESAAYTYDNLGRLLTSNQTTNSTSAQRRFVYDRFGNRTGMWDATSGGNQIQSVNLQQSGGAPTNRLTSVTNGSTTVNYLYDANGNVTNDVAHSYTYDAENRVVSVDAGTTAQYAYDQQNRRVKKVVSGTTTHYVWEGGQVIAEHNGSTGAVITNYTYLGNRMLNKTTSGTTSYFLSDRLSARVTMDANGNVIGRQAHLPFGEELGGSGTQDKHHFTNYESDSETGNAYAVNRGYAQTTGRFNQADPYRASGYMVDPQSWNRYAYVSNDPINYIDTIGLFASTWRPPAPPASLPTPTSLPFGQTGDILPEVAEDIGQSQGRDLLGRLSRCEKEFIKKHPQWADLFAAWYSDAQRAYELAEGTGLPGPEDGQQDAIRHCVWHCLQARTAFGVMLSRATQSPYANPTTQQIQDIRESAIKFSTDYGEAHECDQNTPRSNMDRHNNEVGANISKKPGDCLDLCKEELNAGNLVVLQK